MEALLYIAKDSASNPQDVGMTNDVILILVNLSAETFNAHNIHEIAKDMKPVGKFSFSLSFYIPLFSCKTFFSSSPLISLTLVYVKLSARIPHWLRPGQRYSVI